MRRQFLRSALPAQPDTAAKFAVPHPSPITREPRDLRPVRQRNWIACSFSVNETREKGIRASGDPRELFVSGDLPAQVVGQPPSLQSSDVAGQVFERWPDEFHSPSTHVQALLTGLTLQQAYTPRSITALLSPDPFCLRGESRELIIRQH